MGKVACHMSHMSTGSVSTDAPGKCLQQVETIPKTGNCAVSLQNVEMNLQNERTQNYVDEKLSKLTWYLLQILRLGFPPLLSMEHLLRRHGVQSCYA